MQHQRSYQAFVGLWTAAFLLFASLTIYKYAGAAIPTYLTGERVELTPFEWEDFARRAGVKMVSFKVSETQFIKTYTRKERPEANPMPEQMLRVNPSIALALVDDEPGWVFGIVWLFMPPQRSVPLLIASAFTILLWLPFFSRKSSLDRHRDRVRRQRRHKKASKFPLIWLTKVVPFLFLLLSTVAIIWALADLLRHGHLVPGLVLLVLGLIHIPVMIGMLMDKYTARLLMVFLPWSWIVVIPVGTVLAVVTLAALPNMPVHELERDHA